MRKHVTKKSLSLSKTTVRALTDDALAPLAGAYHVSLGCSVVWNCILPPPSLPGTCTC